MELYPAKERGQMRVVESCVTSKSFKIMWYTLVIVILSLIVALVVVFYVPFLSEYPIARTISAVAWALIVYVVYRVSGGREYYRSHPTQHRVVIMFISGALTALTVTVTLAVLWGSLKPYFPHLWIPIILLFFIGAVMGDIIRKTFQKTQSSSDPKWI